MNDTTQANATAKTAFGCLNGLAAEPVGLPVMSAPFGDVRQPGRRPGFGAVR